MSDRDNLSRDYDITIIGGGMVGISFALLLAQQYRWKIAILESQPLQDNVPAQYSPSFDARSTALSWSSRNILKKIGVWERIQQQASAISTIHVSDRGHMGLCRIDADDAGVEALGYVVENSWLGAVLLDKLASADISLQGAVEIKSISAKTDAMQITAEVEGNQQLINSKLLVIADGAGSQSSQMLGIQQHSKAYGHSAIIANISLQQPHSSVAYERFTDRGPMALLPLSDFENSPRSALVWTQPAEVAQSLMAEDDETFLYALQDRFGDRLGPFTQVGKRAIYPLAMTTSEEQVRRRLVVVGNAAHSLHPVAGQGFNLSLRDVAVLADCLASGSKDVDIGALGPLQQYQQQRATDQRNTLLFTDNLSKLFGLNSPLVALGRNSGLLLMDLVPTLRKQFAHFGMGSIPSEGNYG